MPLYVDVKGFTPTGDELTATFGKMGIIWSSEPNALLAVWTAQLFGAEGRFELMFPDGTRHQARISRCGPCGGVTFRASCHLCGRTTEPMSPLFAA